MKSFSTRELELLADHALDLGERERSDVVLERAQLVMMSGGTMSGRVESSWPNLTNVGPSSSSISRRCWPRWVGAASASSDATGVRGQGRRSVSLWDSSK